VVKVPGRTLRKALHPSTATGPIVPPADPMVVLATTEV
jgi:hypothetical protein